LNIHFLEQPLGDAIGHQVLDRGSDTSGDTVHVLSVFVTWLTHPEPHGRDRGQHAGDDDENDGADPSGSMAVVRLDLVLQPSLRA
jgi:hypothetical protein